MISLIRNPKGLFSIFAVFLFLGYLQNVQSFSLPEDRYELSRVARQAETTEPAADDATTTTTTTTEPTTTTTTTTEPTTTTTITKEPTTTTTTTTTTEPTTTTTTTTESTTASTTTSTTPATTTSTTTGHPTTTTTTTTTEATTTTSSTTPSTYAVADSATATKRPFLKKGGGVNLLQKLQTEIQTIQKGTLLENKPLLSKWTKIPTLTLPSKKGILQKIIEKQTNGIKKNKGTVEKARDSEVLNEGDISAEEPKEEDYDYSTEKTQHKQ